MTAANSASNDPVVSILPLVEYREALGVDAGYLRVAGGLERSKPQTIEAPPFIDGAELARIAELTLRPGVMLHHDELLTPADAGFSLQRYKGAGAKFCKGEVRAAESLDA